MAVAKLTGSKKGLLFIDDEGNIFNTSVNFIMGLINGKAKHDFVLLSRLPNKAAEGRFKKSPLYDPDGKYHEKTFEKSTTLANDGLSKVERDKTEVKKSFKDKKVW